MRRPLQALLSAAALLAPVLIAAGGSPASADTFDDWAVVDAGEYHTCGIRHGGKLYCWGLDDGGQVGDGINFGSDPALTPRRIGTFEDWANVSAGGFHSCGVRRNGKLYCWGADNDGQIGDGTGEPQPALKPRRIGTFEDWANATAGYAHSCGVRRNGKLYCWGNDENDQVGDGDAPGVADTPRRIGTFEDWISASAGGSHTCGIRHGGKLYCWGLDTYGQVGDGSPFVPVSAPKRIGTFEDWATVTAGFSHTCGVRTNGKLYCWGRDDHGQVGDGDFPFAAITPRRIGTFEDWANASAGGEHTCGVRANGKLYCWGRDDYGQVGDGTDPDHATSPRHLGAFEDWGTSAGGGYHSCGIRHDGKLYCWGRDTDGQVGDGTNPIPASTPRRI